MGFLRESAKGWVGPWSAQSCGIRVRTVDRLHVSAHASKGRIVSGSWPCQDETMTTLGKRLGLQPDGCRPLDEFITLVHESGLPPIKCSWCRGSQMVGDDACGFCNGLGVRARCTCCKGDEIRILGTTHCRECEIDCMGEHPCRHELPSHLLLAVAGTS